MLHVRERRNPDVGLPAEFPDRQGKGGGAGREDPAGAAPRTVVAYRLPHVVRRGVGEVHHLAHCEVPIRALAGARDGDRRFQQPRQLHGGGVHGVVAGQLIIEGQTRAVADRTDQRGAGRDPSILAGRREGPGLVDYVKRGIAWIVGPQGRGRAVGLGRNRLPDLAYVGRAHQFPVGGPDILRDIGDEQIEQQRDGRRRERRDHADPHADRKSAVDQFEHSVRRPAGVAGPRGVEGTY